MRRSVTVVLIILLLWLFAGSASISTLSNQTHASKSTPNNASQATTELTAQNAYQNAPHSRWLDKRSYILAPGIGDDLSPPGIIGNATRQQIFGTIRLLVILAAFKDIPPNRTLNQIKQDYFGSSESVAAYYHDISYGKLTIVGDVFGWYTLPYAETHYGTDCSAIDDAACDGSDASWQIAQDAVNVIKNVNSSNYDYFVFVHSGNGEESGVNKTDVWSVAYLGGIYIRPLSENSGRTITKFDIVPETEGRGTVPLGVYCHEFGHLLGLPDLYDTHTGKTVVGSWELMDKGLWNGDPPGSTPSELSTWSRVYLGWLSSDHIASLQPGSSQPVLVNALERMPVPGGYSAVKVADGSASSDYFLFEDRQPIGSDSALPSWGIVGYKVNANTFDTPLVPIQENAPPASIALTVGSEYADTSSGMKLKVLAHYQNGSYLVGFGKASFLDVQASSTTLTVTVDPPQSSIPVTVDGVDYQTDASGLVTVTVPFNPAMFNITVPLNYSLGSSNRLLLRGWNGGQNSTIDTFTVNATQNATVTVRYRHQYHVSVTSQYGSPTGSGWCDANQTATITIQSPINSTSQSGTRYRFNGFDNVKFICAANTCSSSVMVNKPLNLTALWITQYYMLVSSAESTIPTIGTGWYDQGKQGNFSVIPPQPQNGIWYVFKSWTGDYTGNSPAGKVTVTKPMVIKANWNIRNQMSITFADAAGNPLIDPNRVTQMQLQAPNATTLTFTNLGLQNKYWLDQGTYKILSVTVLGVNAATGNQTIQTKPNGQIQLNLALYNLDFDVRDSLFNTPINNAAINLTLVDGSTISTTTTNGEAEFSQLPEGSYQFQVTANYALATSGKAQLNGGSYKVTARTTVISSVAITASIPLASALTFYFIRKRRRLKQSHVSSQGELEPATASTTENAQGSTTTSANSDKSELAPEPEPTASAAIQYQDQPPDEPPSLQNWVKKD
jgi:M6 family metalloprotease-like protein